MIPKVYIRTYQQLERILLWRGCAFVERAPLPLIKVPIIVACRRKQVWHILWSRRWGGDDVVRTVGAFLRKKRPLFVLRNRKTCSEVKELNKSTVHNWYYVRCFLETTSLPQGDRTTYLSNRRKREDCCVSVVGSVSSPKTYPGRWRDLRDPGHLYTSSNFRY